MTNCPVHLMSMGIHKPIIPPKKGQQGSVFYLFIYPNKALFVYTISLLSLIPSPVLTPQTDSTTHLLLFELGVYTYKKNTAFTNTSLAFL